MKCLSQNLNFSKKKTYFFTKNQLENSKILMDLILKRLTDNQVTASVKNSKIQKFKRLRFPWPISFLIRKLDFVHVKLYRVVVTGTFIDRGENGRVHRVKEDGLIETTRKIGCRLLCLLCLLSTALVPSSLLPTFSSVLNPTPKIVKPKLDHFVRIRI